MRNTNDKPQSEKFKETARAIECDENEAAFRRRLKKLVSAPLASLKKQSKPKRNKASK
jgi:hypothetical protein